MLVFFILVNINKKILGDSLGAPEPWKFPSEPQKNQFVELKLRLQLFFYIKRYLTDKNFDLVWGTPFWNLPKWNPKNQLF